MGDVSDRFGLSISTEKINTMAMATNANGDITFDDELLEYVDNCNHLVIDKKADKETQLRRIRQGEPATSCLLRYSEPDVSLRLALSILMWSRYRENTETPDRERHRSNNLLQPAVLYKSGLRAGKIKGVVTVYNTSIKRSCFILSYNIVIKDVLNSLTKSRSHNVYYLSLKLPVRYVYYN